MTASAEKMKQYQNGVDRCGMCKSSKVKVYACQSQKDGRVRWKRCLDCDYHWTTLEKKLGEHVTKLKLDKNGFSIDTNKKKFSKTPIKGLSVDEAVKRLLAKRENDST